MKSLTFEVMCTVLFGLGRDDGDAAVRRDLSADFQQLVRGIAVVPLDLPFTAFRRCLAASRRGRRAVAGVIEQRRAVLARGERSPADDVVTGMLAEGLPDDEIIDNVMFLMIAAHDTTAALLTFLIRHLESNTDAYDKVVQGTVTITTMETMSPVLVFNLDQSSMAYVFNQSKKRSRGARRPARRFRGRTSAGCATPGRRPWRRCGWSLRRSAC